MGSYLGNYYKAHYKWDGNTWTSISTLPYDFCYGSAVVLDDKIYIIGSDNTLTSDKVFYKWDGSSWTSISNLTSGFFQGSAVVYKDTIHRLGGANTKKYHYRILAKFYKEVA